MGPGGSSGEAGGEARRRLADAGYSVLEPRDVASRAGSPKQALRDCAVAALRCGGVALLPGWDQSREARLIETIAGACGVGCHALGWWERRARAFREGRARW